VGGIADPAYSAFSSIVVNVVHENALISFFIADESSRN